MVWALQNDLIVQMNELHCVFVKQSNDSNLNETLFLQMRGLNNQIKNSTYDLSSLGTVTSYNTCHRGACKTSYTS